MHNVYKVNSTAWMDSYVSILLANISLLLLHTSDRSLLTSHCFLVSSLISGTKKAAKKWDNTDWIFSYPSQFRIRT